MIMLQGKLNEDILCTVVAFDGKFLSLRSDQAFAPGQPLALAVTIGDSVQRVEGRSQGSKRADDGLFDVQLRPVNLRRQTREALEAAFASPGGA